MSIRFYFRRANIQVLRDENFNISTSKCHLDVRLCAHTFYQSIRFCCVDFFFIDFDRNFVFLHYKARILFKWKSILNLLEKDIYICLTNAHRITNQNRRKKKWEKINLCRSYMKNGQ